MIERIAKAWFEIRVGSEVYWVVVVVGGSAAKCAEAW